MRHLRMVLLFIVIVLLCSCGNRIEIGMSIDHARDILAINNVRSGMLVGDIEWPSDYNADFYILRDDSECLAILSRKTDGVVTQLVAMYVPNIANSKGHDIHILLSWIEWDSDGCYIIKFPSYRAQK